MKKIFSLSLIIIFCLFLQVRTIDLSNTNKLLDLADTLIKDIQYKRCDRNHKTTTYVIFLPRYSLLATYYFSGPEQGVFKGEIKHIKDGIINYRLINSTKEAQALYNMLEYMYTNSMTNNS